MPGCSPHLGKKYYNPVFDLVAKGSDRPAVPVASVSLSRSATHATRSFRINGRPPRGDKRVERKVGNWEKDRELKQFNYTR